MNHNHWTNYWQSGAQTSLPNDFKENYDGAILEFWRKVIDQSEHDALVLDVCTGNGAVALILARLSLENHKSLHITAIDVSDINTTYIINNNPKEYTDNIKFISQCPVESVNQVLPEPQDLIVSQYGLEYSDMEKSAPAIAQSLKPNGQLVFIAHSPQSAVFSFMRNEQAIYDWLAEVGLWRVFHGYAGDTINTQEFKENVLGILQSHRPNPVFRGEPLFTQWLQMINQIRGSSTAEIARNKPQIAGFSRQHSFARLRCQDMLNVAEKVSNEHWLNPLTKAGFQLQKQSALYYDSKHLVGDCYHFCLI